MYLQFSGEKFVIVISQHLLKSSKNYVDLFLNVFRKFSDTAVSMYTLWSKPLAKKQRLLLIGPTFDCRIDYRKYGNCLNGEGGKA